MVVGVGGRQTRSQDRRVEREHHGNAADGRNTFVQPRTEGHEFVHTLVPRECRIDRTSERLESFVLTLDARRVQRLHVGKVLEHRTQRDTRLLRNTASSRRSAARFEQGQEGVDDRRTRPLAPLNPPVGGVLRAFSAESAEIGCSGHAAMLRKSHFECNYFCGSQ